LSIKNHSKTTNCDLPRFPVPRFVPLRATVPANPETD